MKTQSLLFCLFLLSGCASTPQSEKIRSDGPGRLPLAVELTSTPFYPQTQHQCGPAALATVMQYYGVKATPEELAQQVYIPQREGSLQIEMTVATRRHDLLPYKLEPQLSSLFTEVAAGNPVLVLQNPGFEWFPQWHYAVVVGYDLGSHDIILRSGTTERWVTPIDVFERTWQRADFWALVIVPVGEIPATAKPLPYLQAAYAFEETGNTRLALKAYRSAVKQWPDDATSWMALGNVAMLGKDWPQAVSAFHTASKIDPRSITSWNNLAYALHSDGCATQAQLALQCALKIAPGDKNLLDSSQELAARPLASEQAGCPEIQCD
jgi:hypothetical protein